MTLAAPDISSLASLALVEATGSVNADLTLDKAEVGQGVAIRANAKDVAVAGTRVGQLDLNAKIADALGLPLIDGQMSGSGIFVSGFEIDAVHATASQVDPMKMKFAADARLAVGTLADLSGELTRLDGGFAATLDTLRLRQKDVTATLTAPATVTMRNGAIELTPLGLDIGQGRLTAQGKLDDTFNLELAIQSLPLAVANAIRPDLGLAGAVNGTASVTGPRSAPNVQFNVDAEGIASSITRSAGLPPVGVRATGQTANGRLNLDAAVSSQNGLAATAKGSVPLGAGNLDVAINLQTFPLALVDRVAGNRGLRGTVSGTGHATGTLADPAASFDLRGEGISATVLSGNGVPALNFTAAGDYRGMALRLNSARVTGAGGLELTGSGTIPLRGPGLDARVSGSAPLSLANPLLADRTAQVTGLVRIDATARGSITAPEVSGRVTLSDGTLIDPETNLRLQGMTLAASLGGNAVEIESFRANVVTGGNITAQGRVGLSGGFTVRRDRPPQQRPLHRRQLREHPAERQSRPERAAGRRRRKALGQHRPRPDRDLDLRGPGREQPGRGPDPALPAPGGGGADPRPRAGRRPRPAIGAVRSRHRARCHRPRAEPESSSAGGASTSSSAAS